jgi:hypothetical protein
VCVLPLPSAHEAAGATGIRRSPRPPRGERFINGSGAWRGEGVDVRLGVIASGAKQSIFCCGHGIFVASLLAMTALHLNRLWLFEN